MKVLSTILLFVFVSVTVETALGETNQSVAAQQDQRDERIEAATTSQNSIEQQRLDLERQKQLDEITFKKDDLALRREQLAAQKFQIILTAASTVIPLSAVLFTIIYNAWTFRKQNEQANIQRAQDAVLQFELKAAEIAFEGKTPLEVRDRGKALKKMFKDRLSSNFLTDYDPVEFGEREGSVESKKFFLELLLKYPQREQQYETLCFWKELFPGDVDWLHRVNLSPHNSSTSNNADSNKTPDDAAAPRIAAES
jgi:hypothetical protein